MKHNPESLIEAYADLTRKQQREFDTRYLRLLRFRQIMNEATKDPAAFIKKYYKPKSKTAAKVLSLVVVFFVLAATAAPPPPLPMPPIHPAPRVRHFQVIKFTNNLTGRAETGVMRLDTITGATWILEDADINGTYVAVWIPINESLASTADLANTNALPVIPASKPASNIASH